MNTQPITLWGFLAAYLTIPVALVILKIVKVRLGRELVLSMVRMSVQLVLVGFYLTIIFRWNNPAINFGYVLLMVAAANYSLLRNSGLKLGFFRFTFPALLAAMGLVLVYFIAFVFRPEPFFDARYVIPIAGMLLGNAMSRTIVTVERFYSSVRLDVDAYSSYLTMGATVREATAPYLSSAYRVGLAPSLASMATLGLVSLPGMMTGQILGGSPPMVAIGYQIAIMLAIFIAVELASLFSIVFSMRYGFNQLGFLKPHVFKG